VFFNFHRAKSFPLIQIPAKFTSMKNQPEVLGLERTGKKLIAIRLNYSPEFMRFCKGSGRSPIKLMKPFPSDLLWEKNLQDWLVQLSISSYCPGVLDRIGYYAKAESLSHAPV